MLKMSASFVLASLRGSEVLEDIFRSPRSILRANGHTQCGWYLLASSLAAALPAERRVLDFGELSRAARRGWAGENHGHFEHPVVRSCEMTACKIATHLFLKQSFSTVY
jgi:hypothetical protein